MNQAFSKVVPFRRISSSISVSEDPAPHDWYDVSGTDQKGAWQVRVHASDADEAIEQVRGMEASNFELVAKRMGVQPEAETNLSEDRPRERA